MKIIYIFILIFSAGCATSINGNEFDPYAEKINKIIETAYQLNGKKNVIVNERKFTNDCSGLVLGLYYSAGIEIQNFLNKYPGNGVEKMYKYYSDLGLLHTNKTPALGDIIFWDNTYDKNGDGKINDEFTHVGVVIDVDSDGGLKIVHYFTGKGIEIENMNLYKTDVQSYKNINGEYVVVNVYMRVPKSKDDQFLASQLFRAFARGYVVN